jgi:hypothetical protein
MLQQYAVPFLEGKITKENLLGTVHKRSVHYLNLFPTLLNQRKEFNVYDDNNTARPCVTVKLMSRQVEINQNLFVKDWNLGTMLGDKVPSMSICGHKDAYLDKWILENVPEFFVAYKYIERAKEVEASIPNRAYPWFDSNGVQFPPVAVRAESYLISSTSRNCYFPRVTLLQPWKVDRTQDSWKIPKRFWISMLKPSSEMPSGGIHPLFYIDPLLELYLFRHIVDLPLLGGVSMRDFFGKRMEKLHYEFFRELIFVPIYARYMEVIKEIKQVTRPIRTDLDFIHFNVTEMGYETNHSNKYLFTDMNHTSQRVPLARSLEEMSHCAIRPRSEWQEMYLHRQQKFDWEELRHCKRVRIIFHPPKYLNEPFRSDEIPYTMAVVLEHDPSCMVCLKGLTSWYQHTPGYSPYKFMYLPLDKRQWKPQYCKETNRVWKQLTPFVKYTFNNAAWFNDQDWFSVTRGGTIMNELSLKIRGHAQFFEPYQEFYQTTISSIPDEYLVAQSIIDTPWEIRKLLTALYDQASEKTILENEHTALGSIFREQNDSYYLKQIARGLEPIGLILESYTRQIMGGFGRDWKIFKQARTNEEYNRKRDRNYEGLKDYRYYSDEEDIYIQKEMKKRKLRKKIYSNLENRDLVKGSKFDAIENYISHLQ